MRIRYDLKYFGDYCDRRRMVIWDEIRSVAIMGDTTAAVIVVVSIAFEPVFELEEDPFTFFIAAEIFKNPGKFFEIG